MLGNRPCLFQDTLPQSRKTFAYHSKSQYTRIILCIYFAIIIVSSLFTLEHLKIVGSNSFHK